MQLPPFLLDQWLNEHMNIEYDLASSVGPHWTTRELLALLDEDERKEILERALVYTHAEGEEELRQALGEMQGVPAGHIQVVTGAAEALHVLFFMAAEPGANIIVPFPAFPPMIELPRSLGIEVRTYSLRGENGFLADPEEIKAATDDRTKLILINQPHNPTGAVMDEADLRDLHDFAAARNIRFVVDEVYHPIYHDGNDRPSAARLPHATVLGDFSKAFSLSGLRVGWMVEHDPELLAQYCDIRSYFTVSNTTLGEALATVAVKHRETIYERVRSVTRANLALLDDFFSAHADVLSWVRPTGSTTAFPWLNSGENARGFCTDLVARGILLAPGDCFGMPEYFRLGFGSGEQGYASALERFSEYLETQKVVLST